MLKPWAEGVLIAAALVGVTWAENRPEERMPPEVRQRVHEVCVKGVLEAIDESTNPFTRKFVTQVAVDRGVARCETSELWWMRRFYNATGEWPLEGYE